MSCPATFMCNIASCRSIALSLRDLIAHMRHFHLHERNLNLICGIHGCPQHYNSVESYRKHVSKDHAIMWNDVRFWGQSKGSMMQDPEAMSSSCVSEADVSTPVVRDEDSSSPEEMYSDVMKWISHEMMSIKLNLECKYGMKNSAVNEVMTIFTDTVKSFKSKLDSCILKCLECQGVKDEFLQFLLKDNLSLDEACFLPQSKEEKVLKEMGYIQPLQVYLHADGDQGNAAPFVHYVPITKTLASYLCHSDVLHSIKREVINDDRLEKFCDGAIMEQVPIFSNDCKSIRIVLYTDEFELCNPIGSHKKKHKMCAVYFSVGNIESKYASSLQSIHLVMLAHYRLVKEHGYPVVLKCLIDDLKILETNGISVSVDSCEYHFHVGLAAVLGDNLSAHAVGGFRSSFSSGRVCRHCMIVYNDLSKTFHESQCTLRFREGHDLHVEAVNFDPSLISVYGVKGSSAFSELQSFHPILSLPPDMMHDVLEGLMPWNLTIVIRGLVRSGVLSIAGINNHLKNFKYGQNDKTNKHPGLPENFMSKKVSLPGTAAEKWHLFRMFSVIFGPFIPEGNKFYALYLLATEICDIILAPVIVHEWIASLSLLITEHHELFVELSSTDVKQPIKPRLHFLIHYPRIISLLGPPRYFSSIRYEAFHLQYKNFARSSNNFKNITHTCATRFQRKRCLQFAGETALPPSSAVCSQKTLQLESLCCDERQCVSSYLGVNAATLISTKQLTLDGQSFKVDDVLILEVMANDAPLCFQIHHILLHNLSWFLLGRLLFPEKWNLHLHSFEISVSKDTDDLVCVKPSQVLPLQNLDMYCIEGKQYVKLRHKPFSEK